MPESEYEKPIFDNEQVEKTLPNLHDVLIENDQTTAETCSTRGTRRECFLEVFLQTDRKDDGTGTDHDNNSFAEARLEQP